MAKYYGAVGFATYKETSPGVHEEVIEEHLYSGDLISSRRNLNDAAQINGNITMSTEISILADPFAYSHFESIRYATYMGTKWSVVSIDVRYPRLLLSMGDVYNG